MTATSGTGMPEEAPAGDREPFASPTGEGSAEAATVRGILRHPELIGMAFQPIVDLARGVVCGYEALARLPAELGTPDVGIAAARAAGAGDRLEALLTRKALDARPRLPANCFLSLNLSPDALGSRALDEVLSERGNLGGVVIEVTEQTAGADQAQLLPALFGLRRSAAALAVDDAGSGYGSLQRILDLRPEFVKVDAALVSGVDQDEAKAAAIEMLGSFASRIDAWLVAEGVERVEELEALATLGVPLAQGYLFAPPSSEMAGISPRLAQLARERFRARTRETGVLRLLQRAPAILLGKRSAQLAEAQRGSTSLEAAVVVDERGRPVGVLSGGVLDGGEPSRPLLVHASAEIADVARRAMTRPAGERFDPVVCCDEAGRYLGLLPVHRLVLALSDERSPGSESRGDGAGFAVDPDESDTQGGRAR